jgi:hypothetical protein
MQPLLPTLTQLNPTSLSPPSLLPHDQEVEPEDVQHLALHLAA